MLLDLWLCQKTSWDPSIYDYVRKHPETSRSMTMSEKNLRLCQKTSRDPSIYDYVRKHPETVSETILRPLDLWICQKTSWDPSIYDYVRKQPETLDLWLCQKQPETPRSMTMSENITTDRLFFTTNQTGEGQSLKNTPFELVWTTSLLVNLFKIPSRKILMQKIVGYLDWYWLLASLSAIIPSEKSSGWSSHSLHILSENIMKTVTFVSVTNLWNPLTHIID